MKWGTLGFQRQKQFFERLIEGGELSHAYLFTGQDMIGKRTFALECASHIVGANREGMHPDVHIVQGGDTISIEEVRAARKFIAATPYLGTKKVVIIDDAYLMTDEAQNAMLKVLEEPPESSVFFLVTHTGTALLPTIVSRCQEVVFSPHHNNIVVGILSRTPNLSDAQRAFLVSFADGRVGLLKKMIEAGSFVEIKRISEEFARLIRAPLHDRLTIAQDMAGQDREELKHKILYCILYMRTKARDDIRSYSRIYTLLRGLLTLYQNIGQPHLNAQFALETFAVSIN